ncbi:MAG: TRAP transporter small permease [Mesorhizobium sp.]
MTKFFSTACFILGCAFIFLLLTQLNVEIFSRAAFNYSIPLSVDLIIRYYMVGLSFIALPLVEMQKKMITAGILQALLPQKAIGMIGLVIDAVSLTVYIALTYYTLLFAWTHYEERSFIMSSTAKLVTWPSYFIIPIAFAVTAAIVLERLLATVRSHRSAA